MTRSRPPIPLPTDPTLAGIRARLVRAARHVDDLERALDDYTARPPYRRITHQGSAPGRIVERAELVDRPPIEAAMFVSDAVHQARAALDNLVNALRPAGPAPAVFFPIRTTAEAYAEALASGALGGVPDWARDAIAALQPFSTDPRQWAGRELPHLNELARRDRHRLPPLHTALVVPDYATADETTGIEWRADRAWQWAECEYDATGGRVTVVFRVEVQFGPDSGQPEGLEVGSWTAYLVGRTASAIQLLMRSHPA